MQFKLSTLMVIVAAVALGCMGWKLGEWMMQRLGETLTIRGTIGLFVASGALLLLLLLHVKRPVLLPIGIGLVIHVFLGLAKFGVPQLEVFWVPLFTSTPIAFFTGSLWHALNTDVPARQRYGYFLPSCFLLGWVVATLLYSH